MNGDEWTTIAIRPATKERIKNLCTKKMSYDEIINYLIDYYQKPYTNDGK